jgi:hypothetical protein
VTVLLVLSSRDPSLDRVQLPASTVMLSCGPYSIEGTFLPSFTVGLVQKLQEGRRRGETVGGWARRGSVRCCVWAAGRCSQGYMCRAAEPPSSHPLDGCSDGSKRAHHSFYSLEC